MARKTLSLLALVLAVVAAGCGGPKVDYKAMSNVVPGPHGGPAYLLPERVGYVEIVNDPVVDPRSDEDTSLVLYFLNPDARTSLNPAPKNVVVRLWHEQKFRKVNLATSPQPNDPAGGSRYITPPGPLGLAGLRGTISAEIGGRRISKEFSGMR